jgi:hypothetical protein
MLSFEQFANMLDRAEVESPAAAALALKETLAAVTVEARSYIGHEMPQWAPLAPSTIAEKSRLGYTGRLSATDPLLRTGEMRDSIENTQAGLEGVVGSNDPVALWMEMGTHRSGGAIPPRPFLALAASRSGPVMEVFFGRAASRLLAPRSARISGGGTP